MININLLDSVTEKPKGVAVVEEKVTNPRMQTMLMGLVVAGLLVLIVGYDYTSSRAAYASAQKELENQQRIQQQMAAINKEQAELEEKTKAIQTRIDAIQKLRSSQQGPVAVLRELKDRIDGVPGLYLESVQQKNNDLVIKGNSPNEASVTSFGRSLEFSSGLFTNLNIETQKKELALPAAGGSASAGAGTPKAAEKTETIDFTIKCSYTPAKASPVSGASQQSAAGNQVAQK
ncbi:MAG TPA: PilN domain-containing protein [Pyrinomonadaceae bacterium]|jgi:Tfp pilus assembly protein PilN